MLQSLDTSNSQSESSEITDEATGKTFTFRKRKGKAMDFLDLLLQTKVKSSLVIFETGRFDDIDWNVQFRKSIDSIVIISSASKAIQN